MPILGRKAKEDAKNKQREIDRLHMLVHLFKEAGHAILQYGFSLRKNGSGTPHDALMLELKEQYSEYGSDLRLAITDDGELLLMDRHYNCVQCLDKREYQLDWEPCEIDMSVSEANKKRLLPHGMSYSISDDGQTLIIWHDGQRTVIDGGCPNT